MGESLSEQLALLKALADRPLTLPPVFVKVTGSITAGLLLRQVLYWMGRTTDPDGWFYKRLPEFQEEMCMGEKEFRTARGILTKLELLQSERRGVPPVVWFRADLEAVIAGIRKQAKGESNSGEAAGSIKAKGQNQSCPSAAPIPAKGQNHDSGERAKSYKEAETTRDYPETTKAEAAKKLSRPERDSWDLRRWQKEMRKSEPQPGTYIADPDAHWRARARQAAYDAAVAPKRIVELLKQHFPNDPNIDLLYDTPLFTGTEQSA